jgi:hypothetical protein
MPFKKPGGITIKMWKFDLFGNLALKLLLLPIVVALDFSWPLSLLIVIALSLQVSVIAYFFIALSNICKRYRF